AAETLTDEQVQAATRAIVEELYRAKDPQRFWDPPSWDPDRHGQRAQAGGYTALAVLALLHAGESYQDPRLRDAVAHLEQAPLAGTYAVAVRAHVWARLPDKFSDRLRADSKWLADAFQQRPRGWGYEMKPRSSWYDNSLAQYGALGLWEAAKRGVPVHDRYWQLLEERFVANQLPDGGWSYRNNQPVTGSMTAAGLTALFITQDYLHAGWTGTSASWRTPAGTPTSSTTSTAWSGSPWPAATARSAGATGSATAPPRSSTGCAPPIRTRGAWSCAGASAAAIRPRSASSPSASCS
ncbi:MAG: hypothetical protein ACYTAQ_10705, partial [Planctomycetota bacterium]